MDGWVDKTNQVEHILRGGRMSLYAVTIYRDYHLYIDIRLLCFSYMSEALD